MAKVDEVDITLPLVPGSVTIQERTLTPAAMLTAAIEKGIDAQGIKTLAEIFERMQAKQAEREFIAALLAFKAECPRIEKSDVGVHNSRFAPLYKIAAIIDPILLKHGLTYSFDTELEEKRVRSICILYHIGGHSTRTTFAAPIDPAPKMTETHATASASSLAERYALTLSLGIVTGVVDDDGKAGTGGETITAEQLKTLQTLLDETRADSPAFWNFAGVQTLAEIPAKDYGRVQQALLQRKAKMRETQK